MFPLKYLSNFWRTLEMPLINYEITTQFKWSKHCILVAGTAANQNIVIIDRRNFFGQPIKNDLKRMIITLEGLQQVKVMITQEDVY